MKRILSLIALVSLALVVTAPAQTARALVDFQASSLTWSNHSANLATNLTTATTPAVSFYGGEKGGVLWMRGRSDYGATSVTVKWATSPDNVVWATNQAMQTIFYITTNSDGSFTATSTWSADTLSSPAWLRASSYAVNATNTVVTSSNLWFRTVLTR